MKAFVHVFLVAACVVACAHGFPGAQRDPYEDDSFDSFEDSIGGFGSIQDVFANFFNRFRSIFDSWSMPNSFEIPEGANTTSTTKIINGHVVTINETTYSASDDTSGTAFRIRVIDVKPLTNGTVLSIGSDADATTRTTATESAETVEDFNNEILNRNGDTLTA